MALILCYFRQYLSNLFSHQEKDTKHPTAHISLTYTYKLFCSPYWFFSLRTNFTKIRIYPVWFLLAWLRVFWFLSRHCRAINKYHHDEQNLTAHNWQKWKRVFLTCPCHEIYRDEAVGLKSCKYTWKNYDLCEYVEFGVISWKIDILSITASLKFESENSFAHVWHI